MWRRISGRAGIFFGICLVVVVSGSFVPLAEGFRGRLSGNNNLASFKSQKCLKTQAFRESCCFYRLGTIAGASVYDIGKIMDLCNIQSQEYTSKKNKYGTKRRNQRARKRENGMKRPQPRLKLTSAEAGFCV